MGRLRRFPDKRFIGVRERMIAYDCDDDAQFAELEKRLAAEDLLGRALLSSFGPDTLAEARNRGFHPR
ncbi:MAG: hypothetical protein KJ698_10840 [Actinobacteria bacterium]|jgi:hypothetical protein|nr:hypothetical protein [Actinomycetota bacterium]MBU1494009.1 hypothetical protein [Actinomycetota bacterium]MBU1866360.1 hypothetical protein [Actinomycetota bacterium]